MRLLFSRSASSMEVHWVLCLTLTGKTIEENLSDFWKNRSYVELAELRMDFLLPEEISRAATFPGLVDLPVILTCRRTADGGQFALSERKRISYITEALKGGYAYLDIEDDIKRPELEQLCKELDVQIIRSHHDFEGVPLDLYTRISKLASKGDIPKMVVSPKTVNDLILIFNVEKELSFIKKKIVIGCGDMGIPTRILYKRTGSFMTFCSEKPVAPGLLTPWSLSELYRSDKVNAQTHIFGVIGNPVFHTVSPQIHNPGFHAIKFNAIYVPFLVDSVRSFFHLAEILKIHGFSVTSPFKTDVLPYLGKGTREVRQTGSCNTVIRTSNLWKGVNTDYYGFLNLVTPFLKTDVQKTALVIGAGGAANSIVWAFRNHNCKVIILNRTQEHAKRLSTDTMSTYDTLENAGKYSGTVDFVVQATSVGMNPESDCNPVPDFKFTGKEVVFELIYKPSMTRFLFKANESGCKIFYGLDLLLSQGKLQFEEFTGYHYPPNCKPFF